MLSMASGAQGDFQRVRVEIEPLPKARARFTGTRAVTPMRTKTAQDFLALRMRDVEPYKGNVAVAMHFTRTTKRVVDVDNLTKLVMDAATQARVWKDDCQVTTCVAMIDHGPVPATEVVFCADENSTMYRRQSK